MSREVRRTHSRRRATPQKSPSAPAPASTAEDFVVGIGRSEEGHVQVLRKKGEEISAGELRPLEDGKPIAGTVLNLRPRADAPHIADVESEVRLGEHCHPRTGPVRAPSAEYDKGWEAIWGRGKRVKRSDLN